MNKVTQHHDQASHHTMGQKAYHNQVCRARRRKQITKIDEIEMFEIKALNVRLIMNLRKRN